MFEKLFNSKNQKNEEPHALDSRLEKCFHEIKSKEAHLSNDKFQERFIREFHKSNWEEEKQSFWDFLFTKNFRYSVAIACVALVLGILTSNFYQIYEHNQSLSKSSPMPVIIEKDRKFDEIQLLTEYGKNPDNETILKQLREFYKDNNQFDIPSEIRFRLENLPK
ncbi:MAG: hypothetical protein SFU98_18810 [Leptospiraceae bacterium]|nr:hypothetical protein [Leptospiraceae bacterium]